MDCKIKKKWIDLEMEHTNSRKVAKKIAKDHIRESGCKYYPELIKLEKKLENSHEREEKNECRRKKYKKLFGQRYMLRNL